MTARGLTVPPARVRTADLIRAATVGIRARPLRTILAAAGVAIGVAAIVTMIGISTSSRAQLDILLNRLGTNLLTAGPGNTLSGTQAQLPTESISMVDRIGPVTAASATAPLPTVHVYRNPYVASGETNSIEVEAAYAGLPGVVGTKVADGRWFPDGGGLPAVVLGQQAAQRLGIARPGPRVWLGGQWFSVIGILAPVPLAPDLDSSALVSWSAAHHYLGFDGHPGLIYLRCVPTQVEAVEGVLAPTVNPVAPSEVLVSRPSDALAAQRSTSYALNAQLIGLAIVALVIGALGVANTMIIAVLERRADIGLRRSLGATRVHIAAQYLTESIALALAGGIVGSIIGYAAISVFAGIHGWPTSVPEWVVAGSLILPVLTGAAAGLYPAARAAALAPTTALTQP